MLRSMRALLTRLQEEFVCAKNGIGPLRVTKTQILKLFLQKQWLDVKNVWLDATVLTRLILLVLVYFLITSVAGRVWAPYTSLSRRGFPALKRPRGQKRWDFQTKLEAGARLYPNTPYIITYAGFEQIVYPSSSFDEIKALPISQASLMEYFAHTYFEGWHFLGRQIGALHGTLSVDLTRSLPAQMRVREALAQKAFDHVVGPFTEEKSLRLYATVQQLVAITNGPVLFGSELGTNPKWLGGIDLFVYSLLFALFVLSIVPRFLRPVLKYVAFGPNWFLYWRLKRLARPTAEKDLQRYFNQEKSHTSTTGEGSRIAISEGDASLGRWLVARYQAEDRTVERLSHDFIVAMFESLAPTASVLYLILSELASRPEIADDLRAELQANVVNGQLPQSQLSELRKMDSFMRETMRVNIFSHLAVFRRLLIPTKLSVGPEAPAGAVISVDAYNMVTSPEKWEHPDKFDADRFLNMRKQPGQVNQHQFTSLDSNSPAFGGGLQACPGRFFASHSIKVLLAYLLLHYDISLPAGAEKPPIGTLPNGSMMPDIRARVIFRGRKKSL